MSTKTLEAKIRTRIARSKNGTFVLSDFRDFSGAAQVSRVLRKLIKEKLIVRVGKGIYARARISSITQKPVPEQSLRAVAITALTKSGVTVFPTSYERDYNEGKTTQVPTGLVIGVNKRVNKKIGFNGRYVKYEKVTTT